MFGIKIKIFFVALLFFVLGAPGVFAACGDSISGGSGTSGDPYQINDATELAAINNCLGSSNSSKYFKLIVNIDLNVAPYNTGSGWTSIGNNSSYFYGKFDGDYKTISNLYLNQPTTDYVGLFGRIGSGAIVEKVLLANVSVNGDYAVGSLVGKSAGIVRNSGVSSGSVTGLMRLGGLVGENNATLQYSYANVTVTQKAASSDCCVGGLTGGSEFGGTTTNSYSRGPVIHTSSGQGSIGGCVGNTYSGVAMSYLYSTGLYSTLSSNPSNVGGLIGNNYVSATNSYWDTQTSGLASSGSGTGKTTAQMKDQATYSGWDFDTIWIIDGVNNDGYPYLRWQDFADVIAPTITSISSSKDNGTYKTGEIIDIDVTFSEAVTSTEDVTVTLETGETDSTCTFVVTNSTTGTCNYTVQTGDISADLDATISGTIADQSDNPMSNFIPATSLSTSKDIIIDAVPPDTPVADPVAGTYTSVQSVLLSSVGSSAIYYTTNGDAPTASSTLYSSAIAVNESQTIKALAVDSVGNESSLLTAEYVLNLDSDVPVLSSVTAYTSLTGAIITWATNEDASALVNYGLTSDCTAITDELDTSPRDADHSVPISSLVSCTRYYYKAQSTDAYTNTGYSTVGTFKTTGCTGEATVTATGQGTATSGAGGTLSQGNIALTIPASFKTGTNSAIFQAHQLNNSDFVTEAGTPSGLNQVGTDVYTLRALADESTAVSTFDEAITVVMTYSDNNIGTLDESSLWIYRYDGSNWNALVDCVVDTSANTVTCETTSFSDFAIFGTPITQTETASPQGGGTVHPDALRKIQIEKLKLQIEELKKQINLLIEANSASIVVEKFIFYRDLYLGISGEDVKQLQVYLNSNEFLIAENGEGSKGNETDFFGQLTKSALVRFQKANNIEPSYGFFGPVTRALISK